MSKKCRNPRTGEIFILEEEDEESTPTAARTTPPSDRPEDLDADETESAEDKETEEDAEDAAKRPFGAFRTPFDFLDEIDGKDVEKVVLGAVLGIGGVLAINGLYSFLRRA